MIKLLWHEKSNFLAVVEIRNGGLPLLLVLDDEYEGINPFYSQPISFLKLYSWVDLGDL